ncbi:MAG TPA: hypothetical protein DEV81_10905 [Cyanobacteria bacterium UBA11049]|nr:hypothetical protein [Cyanobacteria bacterium UBA11049]
MIKDDKQLAYSKEWAEKFASANRKIKANEEKRLKDPDGWQLIQDSNDALRQKLVDEIVEYEMLAAHNPNEPITLQVECMNKITDLLIKARIAFKITKKELAALCERSEEQIKLFEDKDYQNATFLDFLAVSDALGVEIIDGKFIAKMDEFYLKRLEAMRSSENMDAGLKAAS